MWLTAGSMGLTRPDIPGKGTTLFNLCRDLTTGARRVSGCRDTIRGASLRATSDRRSAGLVELPLQRRLYAVQAGYAESGRRTRGLGCPTLGGWVCPDSRSAN